MMRAPLAYAGRLERLLANLIDTIIQLFPAGLMVALLGGQRMAVVATFATSLAYYTLFTAGSWQATPGKRLLGIYVAHRNGTALTYRDALERFLAYVLPSLPIYASFIPEEIAPILVFWLSIAWFAPILLTPERMGLHDRMCRTHVLVGRVNR